MSWWGHLYQDLIDHIEDLTNVDVHSYDFQVRLMEMSFERPSIFDCENLINELNAPAKLQRSASLSDISGTIRASRGFSRGLRDRRERTWRGEGNGLLFEERNQFRRDINMPTRFHQKQPKDLYAINRVLPKYGAAIYLPQKLYNGENLLNWLSQNSGIIQNAGNAASSVVGAASGLTKLGIDTVKGIQEINRLKKEAADREAQAKERILQMKPGKDLISSTPTGDFMGSGFKFV